MELAGPVVVQDLAENSRVSATESFARVSGETSPAIWKVFNDNPGWKTTVRKLINSHSNIETQKSHKSK